MTSPFPAVQVSVSSTVTTVFTGYTSGNVVPQVAFKNLGPVTVYLGSSSVTPTTGFPVEPGETHMQGLYGGSTPGRAVYAVTESGVSTLACMRGI